MSFQDGKVILYISRRKNAIIIWSLLCIQAVLSVVLSISLAAHIIWPESTRAASGSPLQIAYEGRLTDATGNALGGTGTPYCFRFSIYDAATSGNKLWPAAATPTALVATSTDGVFNTIIGSTDSLSSTVFDFSTTSTAYLQVDVSSAAPTCSTGFESLTPRQQILSSPYTMTANNINYLRSDTVNSKAQVGTTAGAGATAPVYLALDVKNTADYVGQTCTTNGLMWYNSATSHGLICAGGIINNIGTLGTTTIAAVTTNSATPVSNGTINFSNSNNVSFGISSNGVVTATATFAGGAGVTMNSYVPQYPLGTTSQTGGAMGTSTASAFFMPVIVPQNLQFNLMRIMQSISFVTSTIPGSQTISSSFGLFSNNAGTLSLISSNSFSLAISNSSISATISYASATATNGYGYTSSSFNATANIQSSFGTVAYRIIGLEFGNTMSLSPGVYWLGLMQRQSSSSANIGLSSGLVGNSLNSLAIQGVAGLGNVSNGTNFSLRYPWAGFGPYTSTASAGYGGTAMPSSVFLSGITNTLSMMPLMSFAST